MTVEKNARELRVGDVIFIREGLTFTIEEVKPSPLTGFGAPIIIGTYSGGVKSQIDLGKNERLTDHRFIVLNG
jgi:hypothetical protein